MTLITFQDGKPVMRDGKVGAEQACCCGGDGACCFCVREMYYFAYSPDESFESRSISVNGGAWFFGPDGAWQCQNILDGNGNFLYKFCSAVGTVCRLANYVWDNADNRGADGNYSAWSRLDERNVCLVSDCDECEQCRDLDGGDSVEVLISKLSDRCGGCCEGLTCADIEEVNEFGVVVTPCTIGDCNPFP